MFFAEELFGGVLPQEASQDVRGCMEPEKGRHVGERTVVRTFEGLTLDGAHAGFVGQFFAVHGVESARFAAGELAQAFADAAG